MTTEINGLRRIRRAATLFLVLLFLPSFTFATQSSEKKFDAGDLIMEHVNDAYNWHVAGNFYIHLPVILYSSGKGLTVFSAAELQDGATYKGYKIVGGKITVVNPDGSVNKPETAKLWDASLTRDAFTIVFVGVLLLLLFTAAAKGYKTRPDGAPKGLQSFMEPIIIFVRDDIAVTCIGKEKHAKYMPYLLTLFFFIVFFDILGLFPFFPGGANTTGNVAITTTLACFTFLITLGSSTPSYWSHTLWMPGVPALVKILILTPIEIMGVFLKPFTLLIRIFANILAGHVVALSFFSLIFIFGAIAGKMVGYSVSVFSVAFAAVMLLLDLIVAIIQAYVFTLLSAIYFGMVTAETEHH